MDDILLHHSDGVITPACSMAVQVRLQESGGARLRARLRRLGILIVQLNKAIIEICFVKRGNWIVYTTIIDIRIDYEVEIQDW